MSEPERTRCPHCGLLSRTARDGTCTSCWRKKDERSTNAREVRPVRDRGPRGGSILDDLLDDYCCWYPALALVVAAVVAGRRAYRGRV